MAFEMEFLFAFLETSKVYVPFWLNMPDFSVIRGRMIVLVLAEAPDLEIPVTTTVMSVFVVLETAGLADFAFDSFFFVPNIDMGLDYWLFGSFVQYLQ